MAELCSGKFNVAYCCDPARKLSTPPPPQPPQIVINNLELDLNYL
jgi:hypothetical protein